MLSIWQMNINHQPSQFYQRFSQDSLKIKLDDIDDFHCQLYFSYIITLMEKYLSDVFIYEISQHREYLIRLAQHHKFQSESLKIPYLLHHSVEDYMINSIKNLVWHRLNDVETLYKLVLNISFNKSHALLNQMIIRHDIVHRNGFTLSGEQRVISPHDVTNCLTLIQQFILDVDKKYQQRPNIHSPSI